MGKIIDKFRKRLHPILLNAMPSRISVPVKKLNSIPNIAGNKLFAINHSCVLDGPVAAWVIKEHFYYLIGKQRLQFVDRLFY